MHKIHKKKFLLFAIYLAAFYLTTLTYATAALAFTAPYISNSVAASITVSVSPAPSFVKTHIFKYLDGSQATVGTANNVSFPMMTTFDAANLGSYSNVPFTLKPGGWSAGDIDYEASTSDMTTGADYSAWEVTGGDLVGANCDTGQPYALKGYTIGETLAAAKNGTPSTTVPDFQNMQSDKYVIAWNETCLAEQPGTGEIRGTKYEDKDGDGKLEHGEHRKLSGWKIYLDTNDNGKLDAGELSTVTKKNGSYSFKGLSAGNYQVREVLRDGWMQTYPASGKHDVTVVSGKVAKKKDFGNFKLGTISGMKFEDKNGNGRKDRGESGLSGWMIKLMKPGQNDITVATDANGNYRFDNLPAGNYTVREVQQDGWEQTTSNPHSVFIHSGDESKNNNFGDKKK